MTKKPAFQVQSLHPRITVNIVEDLSPADLNDLCDAADAAIESGGGFGWVHLPARDLMERYWKGVLAVPERHLLVARVDGVICGAVQLIEPSRHNEAQAFMSTMLACFVAPYARNLGSGRRLMETAEKLAMEMGYKALQLDVRETQAAAIHLYEALGYRRWGVNPVYAMVDGKMINGYYYSKIISPLFEIKETDA